MNTILLTIRTYKHLPYVYRLVNQLANTFRCVIHVDERWDSCSLASVKNSPLLSSGIEVEPAIKLSFIQRTLCELKEFYTYIYYVNRFGFDNFYTKRWRGYQRLFRPLVFIARNYQFRRIILSGRARAFFCKFYRSGILTRYYAKNNVKAVICTSLNLRYSNEEFYLQTANLNGISSYYPVLTWDNLSTKGSFIAAPSTVFCFNESQKRQLKKWHRVISKVEITGSVFFEKWNDLLRHVKRIDIDSEVNHYFLYLGSSSNIIGDERQIITILSLIICIINSQLATNVKLLVKNHPAKVNQIDQSLGVSVYDDFGLCESQDEELRYAYLLRNARAVFGVNTSGLIDATFVNANVYAITDVGKSRQGGVLHFEEMCNSFGINKISLNDLAVIRDTLNSLMTDSKSADLALIESDGLDSSRIITEYICAKIV